jgi:Methyltransferase domain
MTSPTPLVQQGEKRRKVEASNNGNNEDSIDRTDERTSENHFSMSDDEFCAYMAAQLQQHPLSKDFPGIFEKAPRCITKWRRRFADNPALWKRLFDKDRVTKEFIEAVPVLDAVVRLIAAKTSNDNKQYTIVDLCSGKGYLSMLLSELLPPEKVFRIILMDKAFAMRNQQLKPHHINWEHIYGVIPREDDSLNAGAPSSVSSPPTYYDTWPISLDASKQDLKASRQLANIRQHHFSKEHPAIILAIHLCGTLSLRAVQLFNDNPDVVHFLALKPCCLPGMVHAKRHEIFQLGNHQFDAKEVCIHGKWKQNKWVGGPPRSHIQQKFQVWAQHLYCGIIVEDAKAKVEETSTTSNNNNNNNDTVVITARKLHCRVMVQQGGGFQNDFLFAQRTPTTAAVWEHLQPYQVSNTAATTEIDSTA